MIVGDVNGDGDVDSLDALWVLWWLAGFMPLLPYPEAADVNQDGTIDARDAALILQFEAGLIRSLPPSGFAGWDWTARIRSWLSDVW